MALSDNEIEMIRAELLSSQRPLIFFHDDPDGLASFLLVYRFLQRGFGVVVKANPKIDAKFLRKVEEYQPDKIFVLDIAMVDQEFIDSAGVPVVWVDHHAPLERKNILYFNPRVSVPEDNFPVTHTCYRVVRDSIPADVWIGAVGCVGDWFLPEFMDDFCKKYPHLIASEINTPDDALFNSKLGELVRIFSFILVGTVSDAMRCVKILTRVEGPDELLYQKNAAAKYVMKKYLSAKRQYDVVLNQALKEHVDDGELFVFTYSGDVSFTKDLANELQYKFPEKIIVVGRDKSGEIKMSIRAKGKIIPPVLDKALIGIEGYGGGHEYACGACVNKKDFKRFLENLKNAFDGKI